MLRVDYFRPRPVDLSVYICFSVYTVLKCNIMIVYNYHFSDFNVSIFVDFIKHGVLSLVGEIRGVLFRQRCMKEQKEIAHHSKH